MAHRQVIRDNLEHLNDLTSISERFLDKCLQDRILNISEKETLEEIRSRYSRNRAFYEILRQKEIEILAKVLEIMDLSDYKQSNDVINILRSSLDAVLPERPSSTGNSRGCSGSKEMSLRDTHWIATRLSGDPEANEKREIVYGLLNLSPGELSDLKRKAKDSGTESYAFFSGCINKFISSNVGVTFSQLNDLLEEDFPAVMHAIMSDRRAV